MNTLAQLESKQLEFLVISLGMVLASVTLISCAVAVQWRKLRIRELELAFKDDLLERGMSAADVDLMWNGSKSGLLTQCSTMLAACWQRLSHCLASCLKCCQQLAREVVHCLAGVFEGCATFLKKTVSTVFQDDRHQAEQDLNFKREMLDRGMSVEEIERLLNAGSTNVVTQITRTTHKIVWILVRAMLDCCRTIWSAFTSLYHSLFASRSRSDDRGWDRV